MTHNTSLTILSTKIRQDEEGRYCLNDCHKAAGADPNKAPSEWTKSAQTKALIEELSNSGNSPSKPFSSKEGRGGGTYGSEELVLAYAQWISPAFHVQCLRALLTMMKGEPGASPTKRSIRKPSLRMTFRTGHEIAKLMGLDDKTAGIKAGRYCLKKCGENPLEDMGLLYQDAPEQDRFMTATKVAEALGMAGGRLGERGNALLEAALLQTYSHVKGKKIWTPTEIGMAYARLSDVGKAHADGSVQTYLWSSRVIEILKLHVDLKGMPEITRRPFAPKREAAA
ncbi:KilA-N domain-containing protein [Gluconacetobacter asukensis]|uniref:KilA-N domain-containing protein n=1 Tax=Gluconacetobacter asukensis TaxID=1017181 RepID=A0A7W4J1C8_9PROT|nr:KilA-N domain-containing protein [Gluconacetobacter asukensis]MBB2172884.1 KilA-N domain-containing protein [Gluconacetobacter asukensis]